MNKYDQAISALSELLLDKNSELFVKDIEIDNLKKKIEELESSK